MNADSLGTFLQWWKREFERRRKIPTQYPNSDQLSDAEKEGLYCEMTTANENSVLDGTETVAAGEPPIFYYTETGDMVFTFYMNRGDGEGDFYEKKDDILEIFTDRFIGPVQFFVARIVPLVPVEEKWLIQVIAPYETCYKSTQKEDIP